jgi:hypothetical protein
MTNVLSAMAVILVALLSTIAYAYPDRIPCSTNSAWVAGNTCPGCTRMSAGTVYQSGASNNNCVISAPAVYNPCFTYSIQVTSSSARGHKLNVLGGGKLAASSVGTRTVSNDGTVCRATDFTTTTSTTNFIWTAPAGASPGAQTFAALCGNQADGVYAATKVTPTVNATADAFAAGCPSICQGNGCATLAGEETQPLLLPLP